MGYRIRRVDRNQNEIVRTFRKLGCIVQILSEVGRGCPDIAVTIPTEGWPAIVHFVEIKDGALPPSARSLTPDEVKWGTKHKNAVTVVQSVEDALNLFERLVKSRF